MNADQKAFLDAEATAEQLVSTLDKLKEEIESFQTAKSDLSAVRDKLERLIEASASIGADTQEVVKNIKRIGGPELMERIEKSKVTLEERISTAEATIQKRMGRLQLMVILVGLISVASAVFATLLYVR